MNNYKEFQFGWMIVVSVVLVEILMFYLYFYQLGDRPIPTGGFILITGIMVLTLLLFYGLTTTVTSTHVTTSFGVGIIRRKIALTGIKTVTVVTNPWYYGWGLRFIPRGMMYNMSGFKAVELSLIDSDRIFRIGTRNPERLKEEIERRLQRHGRTSSNVSS